jgi:hypothetical protein
MNNWEKINEFEWINKKNNKRILVEFLLNGEHEGEDEVRITTIPDKNGFAKIIMEKYFGKNGEEKAVKYIENYIRTH